MDKLQLTGQNPSRDFNLRSGLFARCAFMVFCYRVKLPNLKLKIRPKQLLGSLPLDIALPGAVDLLIKVACFVNDLNNF
jgi:hypothetical protein